MIVGKKIELAKVERQSIEQLREWRNNPELRKYFREHREINKENQRKWYEDVVLNSSTSYNFEIKTQEDSTNKTKLIGHCGLHYINWVSKTGEFGIYIGDINYRKGGFGSDALRTLIRYGFEQLNLNRIWCEAYSNNEAIEIYRHIGFKDEGVLRQTVFKNGEYLDSYVLGMLKSDYDKLKELE